MKTLNVCPETAVEASDSQEERHPLQPFMPAQARLLMLGSFPPPRKRWSMNFFYPNLQNDMWRIFGLIFRGDKTAFVDAERKCFRQSEIVSLLSELGVALYDAAAAVRRLQGNASDKFLQVTEPADLPSLLRALPSCRAVAATGQKATDVLRETFSVEEPPVGEARPFSFEDRSLLFYRMPSSSRAYPLKLEKKAEVYRRMFQDLGLTEGLGTGGAWGEGEPLAAASRLQETTAEKELFGSGE